MVLAGLVCLVLFLVLLTSLHASWADAFDTSMLKLFGHDSFLSAFSFLGSEAMLGGGAIVLLVFLLWKRNRAGAAAVFLGVAGGNLLNKALKEWVARERPPFPHGEDGFSFVSGHAMVGIIFYLLAAYFICFYTGKKAVVYTAAFLLAFLSGLSRIAEKAHYATDVAAGWLLGGAVFFFLAAALNKHFHKHIRKKAA